MRRFIIPAEDDLVRIDLGSYERGYALKAWELGGELPDRLHCMAPPHAIADPLRVGRVAKGLARRVRDMHLADDSILILDHESWSWFEPRVSARYPDLADAPTQIDELDWKQAAMGILYRCATAVREANPRVKSAFYRVPRFDRFGGRVDDRLEEARNMAPLMLRQGCCCLRLYMPEQKRVGPIENFVRTNVEAARETLPPTTDIICLFLHEYENGGRLGQDEIGALFRAAEASHAYAAGVWLDRAYPAEKVESVQRWVTAAMPAGEPQRR